MTLFQLPPSARQLRDATWEGFWLGCVIWLPLGALGGWLMHALLSGANP